MYSIAGRWGLRLPWLHSKRAITTEHVHEEGNGAWGPAPYVTVYIASSLPEAHVIRGKLETEDVPVLLRYESGGTVFGLVGGPLGSVEVQVPRALQDRACLILEEVQE